MKTIKDVLKYVEDVMGKESTSLLESHTNAINCWAKFLSLGNLDMSNAEAKEFFIDLAERSLTETVNFFLAKFHATEEGYLEINVSYDCVYDKDMNVIKPLKKLFFQHKEIINIMVKQAMLNFRKGQKLGNKIYKRQEKYLQLQVSSRSTLSPKDITWDSADSIQSTRDYVKCPPTEKLEIEIMRLERKLPNLSSREGSRLSKLYAKTASITL